MEWKNALFIVILVLLPAVYYAESLNTFFLSDAADILKESAERDNNFFFRDYLGSYRPVAAIFSKAMFLAFGFEQQPYHIVSIFLHAAISLLLFRLANIFLKNSFLSFVSAVFFSVFYMNHETVIWLGVQSHLLMKFFFLFTIIFFIRFLQSKSKISYIASLLFFFLSIFSEEGSLLLIVLLAITEIVFFFGTKNFLKKMASFGFQAGFWKKYLPFAFIELVFLLILFSIYTRPPIPFNPLVYLLLFKDIFVFLFVPFEPLRGFFLLQPSANFLPFAISFAAFWILFVAVALFVFFKWKNNAARFGLLFLLISISPVVFYGGLQSRYFYLPSMGTAIFWSAALSGAANFFFKKLFGNKKLAKNLSKALILCLLALFCASSFFYIQSRINEWNQASSIFLSALQDIKNAFPDSIQGKNIFLLNRLDQIGGNFGWDAAPVLRYGIESALWILTQGKKPEKIYFDINSSLLSTALADGNSAVLFFDSDSNRFRKAKRILFGENLLQNNGFENAESNWQQGIVADASKKFSGNFSGRIQNSIGLEKHFFSEKVIVNDSAPQYYYFAGRVFNEADGAQILFFWWSAESRDFYPGKKGKDFDAVGVFTGNKGSWGFLESTVQLPKSARAASLRLSASGNGSAWFDDLEMKKLSVEFETN